MSKEKEKKRLGRGLNALLSVSSGGVNGEMLQTPYVPAPTQEAGTFTLPGLGDLHREFGEEMKSPSTQRKPVPAVPKESVFSAGAENGMDLEEREGRPGFHLLPVTAIQPNPYQPREEFDKKEIQSLADSMAAHGLLQAILVRRAGAGFQVIAGERRLRAAMRLHWEHIPATIIDASDRDMAELALIENIQRKDLNPIEKAISFQDYLERHACTQDELAKRLNVDRSTIANFVRLLGLPPEIQNLVRGGEISQGHARALLPLEDNEVRHEMCERIQGEGLSVRQTEAVVSDWLGGKQESPSAGDEKPAAPSRPRGISEVPAPEKSSRNKKPSDHILDLEQQLREAFGLKVKLTSHPGGRGKLEVFFRNHAEFESLMDFLRAE